MLTDRENAPRTPAEPPSSSPPSPWVERFAALIRPGGRVLDLAAGGGRHSHYLQRLGHRVTAADRDVAALAPLAALPGCSAVEVDLEDGGPWRLGDDYDGIVVTNYLHRPLLPRLPAALAPGGVLIYETFAAGNERFGKPSNPDFLLRPGELIEAFAPPLTIVAFEQGAVGQPCPAVRQRIAAVAAPFAEVRLPG